MNYTDMLIIYFSIGAPFGVHRYFQTRFEPNRKISFAQNLFTFCFWLPSAFKLLTKHKFPKKILYSNRRRAIAAFGYRKKNLHSIQKRLEKILLDENLKFSIYEFRETLERYVGLTAAGKVADEKPGETGKEFFRAAQNKNTELAVKCFYRRNRRRLSFHQTLARQDFLRMLADVFSVVSGKTKFIELSLEFISLVEDSKAKTAVKEMFANRSQSGNYLTVRDLEKDLCNTQPLKPLPANSISTLIQPMSATNLLIKD